MLQMWAYVRAMGPTRLLRTAQKRYVAGRGFSLIARWEGLTCGQGVHQAVNVSTDSDPRVCSIEAALNVIGEKWTLLVVRELLFGTTRFADIFRNTGAPRDILAKRLRSLERAGIIYRRPYSKTPGRFEYRLTPAGKQLHGVLVMIRVWGDAHARRDPENIVKFRHICAANLKPELQCAHCGEVLQPDAVIADRDLRRSQVSSSHAGLW